jgi:hypothetical protein
MNGQKDIDGLFLKIGNGESRPHGRQFYEPSKKWPALPFIDVRRVFPLAIRRNTAGSLQRARIAVYGTAENAQEIQA